MTVYRLMGHASPVTTSRYDRRDEKTKMDAATKIHFPMVGNEWGNFACIVPDTNIGFLMNRIR